VKIFVAGSAGLGDADKGLAEILLLDEWPHGRGDVLGRMAFPAFDADVLSFQDVARLFMIEGLGVPFDDGEVNAVVVGVALRAALAGAGRETVGEVQALVSRETRRDLGMTFQAFERGLSACQLVAGDTVRSAFKIFMRTSERAG